jgi:hypothetical protein
LVADRGAEVILQVHEPVERLMHSLAVVRDGRAKVARLGIAPLEFDLEGPLMSLPAVSEPRWRQFPGGVRILARSRS